MAIAQPRQFRIGAIDFFGYGGLALEPIRAALPIHEGDSLAGSDDAMDAVRKRVIDAVMRQTGNLPTDVAVTCCDRQGRILFYIGLRGATFVNLRWKAAPAGSARLPAQALKLYSSATDAIQAAVSRGASGEDDSHGYTLSVDPAARKVQLAMRDFALRHEPVIRSILQSSSTAADREAAAALLGYGKHSSSQIVALVRAARDPEEGVRNNAIRALSVIAGNDPAAVRQIPAAPFLDMLRSGIWKDRNKSLWLWQSLTSNRESSLLSLLCQTDHDALLEMARWRDPNHADTARTLVGRCAGIPEQELQQMVSRGDVNGILARFAAKRADP